MLSQFVAQVRELFTLRLIFFRLIHLCRLQVHVIHLFCQPFRREHLHLIGAAQEVGTQVYRGSHVQFKVCKVFTLANLPLAVVNRQVSDVESLIAKGPDDNSLCRSTITHQHTIALVKILLCVKVRVYLELNVSQRHLQNPVKREHTEVVRLRLLLRCIPVEVAQDIPALLEQFDAVRLKVQVVGLVRAIFPVFHGNPHALLHRVHHHLQVFPLVWHLLQQNPVLQRQTLTDHVVHRECRQHPVLHAVLPQHIVIADVVLIPVLAVTVNVDAEDVLNGILMSCKGRTSQFYALAHIRLQPFLVDLCKRNPPSLANGVHKPDILLELCRYLHTLIRLIPFIMLLSTRQRWLPVPLPLSFLTNCHLSACAPRCNRVVSASRPCSVITHIGHHQSGHTSHSLSATSW